MSSSSSTMRESRSLPHIRTNHDDEYNATIMPSGLHQIADFITNEESNKLIGLIDHNEWSYEGFEDRRRVQRYSIGQLQQKQLSQGESSNNDEEENHGQKSTTKDDLLSFLNNTLVNRFMENTKIFPRTDDGDDSKELEDERPNEIVIEERKLTKSSSTKNFFEAPSSSSQSNDNNNKKRPTASIFESNIQSQDETCTYCTYHYQNCHCKCYVAQLTLLTPCIQSLNKPKKRNIECWDLHTNMHSVDVIMSPNELLVKKDECFWNWRSRIAIHNDDSKKVSGDKTDMNGATNDNGSDEDKKEEKEDEVIRSITIKFRCIHGEKQQQNQTQEQGTADILSSNHTSVSSSSLSLSSSTPTLLKTSSYNPETPLHELLTIIVTTSPIKSNPSTEMLQTTFDTFIYAGFEFCYNCPKIIICDGCRIKDEGGTIGNSGTKNGFQPTVTKKHANIKQSLRNGIATSDQAMNYELFKANLIELCDKAGEGIVDVKNYDEQDGGSLSPFRNTRIVQLGERHGYGFALRHALRHEVKTPYVCVIQHDRTFMRHTPIHEVVKCMTNNGMIKYVGMNMRSNLCYRDIFTSKYASGAMNQLLEMVITPPELALDASIYGPNGVSVEDMVVTRSDTSKKLMNNLSSLARSYKGTIQCTSHINPNGYENDNKQQLSLTPTLFWYDNTHVCETSHYRDFIFNPRYKMVVRGGFVEDKLSPVITRSVERLGLKEGHSKFGCYILDDHSGFFFTGHIDGGSFMTEEERARLIQQRSNSRK